MSSYAAVAALNSEQTPEEAAAPQPPQIIPTTGENTNLPDVDGSSISVVPNDYLEQDVKTETQAERIDLDAENAENQAKLNARTAEEHAKEEAKQAKEAAKEKAEKKAKEVEEKVKRKMDKGRDNVKKGLKKAEDEWNEEPEVIVNTALISIVSVALGVFGWQKYKAGRLGWKQVGLVGLGLAAFGGVDYFFTRQFVVKRKNERK